MVELDRLVKGAAVAAVISLGCNVTPIFAQPSLTREAAQIQEGMATGAISPNQATRMAGQINAIQNQEAVDRSMNGGHLTDAEINQVHAEEGALRNHMRGAAMSNGVNPGMANAMFGGHHHHQFQGVMSPYNNPYQQQYQNMPYRPNMGYAQYPNGYMNGQPYYPNNGYYPQQYQNYNQGGLGGMANALKRLF